jgi:hypothetical protein
LASFRYAPGELLVDRPHPLRTHAGIAGGYLGDFVGDGRQWLIADLANPNARPGRIRTIIGLITSAALPYFERFRDPQSVIAGLIEGSDPGLRHELAMEYAALHGGKEKSMAVLGRYLRDAPDYSLAGYHESLQRYRQNGLPAPNTIVGGPDGDPRAFAALALGLESMD